MIQLSSSSLVQLKKMVVFWQGFSKACKKKDFSDPYAWLLSERIIIYLAAIFKQEPFMSMQKKFNTKLPKWPKPSSNKQTE